MAPISKVRDLLLAYENEVLVPLVKDAGILRPVRKEIDFIMRPGTMAFLMNQADNFRYVEEKILWHPLSVVYADRKGTTGTVFSLSASLDVKTETVHFQRAEISGVVVVARNKDDAVWIDPYSGKIFQHFPLDESDKVLMNAWYLFSGAVLPMLFTESYSFVPENERFAFQQTMIRRINQLYQGQGITP